MINFLRRWVRDFFGFSAREINGFLILLPLMVCLIASHPVYRWYVASYTRHHPEDTKRLDSLVAILTQKEPAIVEKTDSLFFFDPNHVSDTALRQLGFSSALSKRLVAYREKGGVFRSQKDLLKIYGMDSALFMRVSSFVIFRDKRRVDEKVVQQRKSAVQSQKDQFTRFDINTADTVRLKSVYGIGTKLASRIVKFRDGLGGFIRMEQLKEVYGLDSAVVKQLLKKFYVADNFIPHQLNLNTAHEQEMSAHPYIRKTLAKAIVSWRFQHGNFSSVDDLEKLKIITPDDIRKISPYLKLDE